MSAITTHVLDTARGLPAAGLRVALHRQPAPGSGWEQLGVAATDGDGRVRDLLAPDVALAACRYRLTFETTGYFTAQGVVPFLPEVSIVIAAQAGERYHVPLLLSPYGYTTYRGS